jgi:hypothetical protein
MTLESDRGAPELSRLTELELVAKPNVAYCRVLPAGWSPMDAERLFIEEIGAIIARLEMQTEQLSLHVEGLKNHTYKGEVARENARLKEMLRQLHYLKKLKELYDTTRVTNPISHLPH